MPPAADTQAAGKRDILTRVGGAWKHQKGDGINLNINARPLNFQGKIVLFPPRSPGADQAQADEGAPCLSPSVRLLARRPAEISGKVWSRRSAGAWTLD